MYLKWSKLAVWLEMKSCFLSLIQQGVQACLLVYITNGIRSTRVIANYIALPQLAQVLGPTIKSIITDIHNYHYY